MSLGGLPGFYFDEEKQKYFRIQKNHIAPPAASRYTQESVQREKRDSRKRKRKGRDQRERQAQTITPAPITKSSGIFGIALEREIGLVRSAKIALRRDEAYVSELEPFQGQIHPSLDEIDVNIHSVSSLQPDGRVLISYNGYGVGVISAISNPLGPRSHTAAADPPDRITFCDQLTSVSVSNGRFAATDLFSDHVYFGELNPVNREWSARLFNERPVPNSRDEVLWTCKINDDHVAIGSEQGVRCVKFGVTDYDMFVDVGKCRAIDWLDQRTIAAGSSTYDFSSGVWLWDVRTNGKSMRFRNTHRRGVVGNHSNNITGLLVANDSGHQLLASTHNCINVLDTRFPKDDHPLLQIPHQHSSPEIVFATNKGSVVTAVDCDEKIIAYSLISGQEIATLKQCPRAHGRINSLIFDQELVQIPMIIASQGKSLVAWKFGGEDYPESCSNTTSKRLVERLHERR